MGDSQVDAMVMSKLRAPFKCEPIDGGSTGIIRWRIADANDDAIASVAPAEEGYARLIVQALNEHFERRPKPTGDNTREVRAERARVVKLAHEAVNHLYGMNTVAEDDRSSYEAAKSLLHRIADSSLLDRVISAAHELLDHAYPAYCRVRPIHVASVDRWNELVDAVDKLRRAIQLV